MLDSTARKLQHAYSIYDMNGLDLVAAESEDQAIKWFISNTNIDPKKLDPVHIDLNTMLYYMEKTGAPIRKITLNQLIEEAIDDGLEFPCIIVTYDY